MQHISVLSHEIPLDETTSFTPAAVAERVTGLIVPPPDIQKIVNKTAFFVSKNGKDFEVKIQENQKNNFSLNFLNVDDPYHGYYVHQLEEFLKGNLIDASGASKNQQDQNMEVEQNQQDVASAEPSKLAPLIALSRNLPGGTPPERQFPCIHPPNIKMLDMDVIKLTAQYAASNGKRFLSGLSQKESNNPQFDFLKPTHMLFSYFTSLVELYTKALTPTEGIKERLKTNVKDTMSVLARCVHRVQYAKQEEIKKRKVGITDEEAQFNAIDWYDFEIVETIDIPNLDEDSNKPQQSAIPAIQTHDDDDMEMEIDDEPQVPVQTPQYSMPQIPIQQQPIQQQTQQPTQQYNPSLQIRENYRPQPKAMESTTTSFFDPVSKRQIPVAQTAQHTRYSLIDPKYDAQHNQYTSSFQTSNLAQDSEIVSNLKDMSVKRPDIFGGEGGLPDPKKQRLLPGVQFTGKEFTEQAKQQMFQEMLQEKQKAGLFPQRGVTQQPTIGPQQQPPTQ